MKKENQIKDKSLDFAVRIYNLYRYLTEQKKEFVISKQILRSGTSIGANASEAIRAESDVDFIHKLSISRKEAEETAFWIELLGRIELIDKRMFESLYNDCIELIKIETSIILTVKKKLKQQ